MSNSVQIDISKDHLKKIVYFILMKFKSDPLHFQGTSAKRDLLGGYIERWFNKFAEEIVLNEILKEKPYTAVIDYFLYGNDSDKNAPDILGLKTDSGSIIPFVKYNNGAWNIIHNMPNIEVKVFRKDQSLLGVRETQLINDFYIFVESDLEQDYLSRIFEDSLYDEKYYKELVMDKIFIEKDEHNQIMKPSILTKDSKIGSFRLIGIYTKNDLVKHTTFCKKDISPYYFTTVEFKSIKSKTLEDLIIPNSNNFIYDNKADTTVYLPIKMKLLNLKDKPQILKRNKGSLYIYSDYGIEINNTRYSKGHIKLNFAKFERNSNWNEYISMKTVFEDEAKSSINKLLNLFDSI